MARRTSPPFRADHVGSLLRPARLLQARDDFTAGQITAADLRAVEDEEIPGAIRMQEEVGLQSATDGEFRRASWHMDFIYALGGVSKAQGNMAVKFHNAAGDIEFTPASIHIDSKLRIVDTIFADAFVFLRDHVRTAVPKLTIPSPNMVHYRGGPAMLDPAVYPDIEEFWADLAAAYADEVARLAALGCEYLQFDDTSLAYLNDPAQRAEIAGRGEDAEQPEMPARCAKRQHRLGVPHADERTDPDVGAVGDETEPGEESQYEIARQPDGTGRQPNCEREGRADKRSAPNNRERLGILGQSRSRNRERVEHDFGDAAACQPRGRDVAELMDVLHPQPGPVDRRKNEHHLMDALHRAPESRTIRQPIIVAGRLGLGSSPRGHNPLPLAANPLRYGPRALPPVLNPSSYTDCC